MTKAWQYIRACRLPALCALLLATNTVSGAAWASLACTGDELTPFRAVYEVERNGKLMGSAEASLKKVDDLWVYRMDTEADRGLAGLLGGKISERSRFTMQGGRPVAREYRYEQGIRFSKRSARANFDWPRLQVSGENRDKKFTLPLVQDQSDRMLVNLKLMLDLSHGVTELEFDTVEKGRVERIGFERLAGPEMIDTPQGRLVTVKVARKHRNPERQTRSWHAPDFAYLPIRMQQVDAEDDEIIEMRIKRWSWEDCTR